MTRFIQKKRFSNNVNRLFSTYLIIKPYFLDNITHIVK